MFPAKAASALLKILKHPANVPPQGGRNIIRNLSRSIRNILFILGGSFDGLDKIIMNRIGQKSIGFGAGRIWIRPRRYGSVQDYAGGSAQFGPPGVYRQSPGNGDLKRAGSRKPWSGF